MIPTKKYRAYIITAVLSVILLGSIFVHIKIYTLGHSFHLDEAQFAESIITRNFINLVATPLLNDQTAPLLYLYTVKLMSVLLGPTETALRIFSLITFLGVLIITAMILWKIFKVNRILTLTALCILSTLSIYMRYSCELKPYMSDSFFVLLVLYLYHIYKKEKIRLPVLSFLYCIAILFSSPALFFAASVFIFEFIVSVIKKDYTYTGRITIAGIVVLACFIIYYLLWLMPVAESSFMIDFWENHRFYLFTIKKEHIIQNILNIARIFRHFGLLFLVYPVLCLTGLVVSLRQKNNTTLIVSLALLFLLTASYIRKYPMEPRLYMFAYAFIVIYSILCIKYLFEKFSKKKYIFAAICFLSSILIINNTGFIKYAEDRIYIETHEVNPLIEYVKKNIKDSEYLYSSESANYILKFKNGYNATKIGSVSYDNILYGGSYNDVDRIINAKRVYLIFQRKPSGSFLEELKNKGNLHKVGLYYQTPLYYFSMDKTDPKLQETFEGKDFREDPAIILKFSIKNIISISVKSDDATDKIIIHIDAYKHGAIVSYEYSINRP